MSEPYVIILSGGGGSRLWPLTRRDRPKFMLALDEGTSLLASTIERTLRVVSADHIVLVPSEAQEAAVREVGERYGVTRIVTEPCGRDTTAIVFLAVSTVLRHDPTARFVTLPADHHIDDAEAWAATMREAVGADPAQVVTIGVVPDRPATEYGYIEIADAATGVTPVVSFREKPDLATAEHYLAAGTYLWNTAMMSFTGAALLELLRLEYGDLVTAMSESIDETGRVIRERWEALTPVALELSLMEPAARVGRVSVIAAAVGWADLGTWGSVAPRVQNGERLASTSPSVALVAPNDGRRRYAVAGLDDVVIVELDDVTLITSTSASADMKTLIAELERRQWHDLL